MPQLDQSYYFDAVHVWEKVYINVRNYTYTTALATLLFKYFVKEMDEENNGRRSLNQGSPELSTLWKNW